MTLRSATISKICKLFPRLASEVDDDVVQAARSIGRLLDVDGSSFRDLGAAMQPCRPDIDRAKTKTKPKTRSGKIDDKGPASLRRSDASIPYDEVVRWANHLIDDCDLNHAEMTFVRQLYRWANDFRYKFTLTEKQAAWWNRLLAENGIEVHR